jgi:predicted PurR-regulated permease PerM
LKLKWPNLSKSTPDASHSSYPKHLLLTVLVVALALFLWAVRDAVLLAFAAVLLAVAVHGIADMISPKGKLPRGLALALAGCLLVSVIVGVIWLFGAQLGDQLVGIIDNLPAAWERARQALSASPLGARFVSEIQSMMSGKGGVSLQEMMSRAGSYTLPLASGVTTALLVIFAAAFLTTDAGAYRRGLLLLVPKGLDEKVGGALDQSADALKKWLLGIMIDMSIIATLLGIALWALGVPAFFGLALIAGFAQFVPTVGPLLASVPAILLAFTVSPTTAMWTALTYLVISQVEANVIYPLIQKKTTSIHPALNLIAVLAFGTLLGPLGVLLATPMLLVLTVFVVRLYVQDTLGKGVKAESMP